MGYGTDDAGYEDFPRDGKPKAKAESTKGPPEVLSAATKVFGSSMSSDDVRNFRDAGIWYDVPYEVYDLLPGLRKSSIWIINKKTLSHYKAAILKTNDPTPSQTKGLVSHDAILEPDKFDTLYLPTPEAPDDRAGGKWNRTYKTHKIAWNEAQEEARQAGKTILEPGVYEDGIAIRDKVLAHPTLAALIRAGKKEVTFQWIDVDTGLLCKGRLDLLVVGERITRPIIVDVKTTVDASPTGFMYEAYKWGYPAQLAMYFDAVRAVLQQEPKDPVLAAIENVYPYELALYDVELDYLDLGRSQYKAILGQIKEAMDTDTWPGYDQGVMPLQAPPYAGLELTRGAGA